MAFGPPTISQERNGWNAVAGHPPMRRRDQWGARRSYTDERTVSHPATRVFVHISITNPENYNSYDAHARALESIGISRFPNTGISYNRLFMAGSTVVREGQPLGRRGAHTVNDFRRSTCSTSGCPGRGSSLSAPSYNLNYNARAYVWCANVQHSVPTAVVELIALAIYTDYRAGFITKGAAQNIHGHRCVSAKSCPGDRMWARIDEVQARVNQLIANGPEDDMPLTDAEWTKLGNLIESKVTAVLDTPFKRTWSGVETNVRPADGGRYAFFANSNADAALRKAAALEALVAELVAQGANELTEEKVRDIIENAVVKVQVSIEGATDAPA